MTRAPSLLLVFELPLAVPVDEVEDPALLGAVVVEVLVAPTLKLEADLVTVTGMLEPLVAGKVLRVEQFIPTTYGQVSVRFSALSSGPVGPDSYFQVTFRFKKLT